VEVLLGNVAPAKERMTLNSYQILVLKEFLFNPATVTSLSTVGFFRFGDLWSMSTAWHDEEYECP